MAAKTKAEFIKESVFHIDLEKFASMVWDAATEAAEARFTSANKQGAPLQQISGKCGECVYSDGNAHSACNTCLRNPMFEDFYEVADAK